MREITGIEGDEFNHSLAALRLARIANGVSKLHGEVSRQMWKDYPNICEITHVTNAQNKKYWADHGLEHARVNGDRRGTPPPQARTQGALVPRRGRPDRQAVQARTC